MHQKAQRVISPQGCVRGQEQVAHRGRKSLGQYPGLGWTPTKLCPSQDTTVSCSLGTLYFDGHCQAVSDCDTVLHGQRVNDQTPKIRANPFLFFSPQLASCPSTLDPVRASTVGTPGTLGFPRQHPWGYEPNTRVNGLCALMETRRAVRSGEE